MKGYLVDTNVPSELTRDSPDANVAEFLRQAGKSSLFLSVMTIGEISKGIAALESGRKRAGLQNWLEVDVRSWFGGRILPITEAIAQRRGSLAAEAKKTGSPITVVDGLIAATALYHDLVLVTRNIKDFNRLGVELLNRWGR